MNKEELLKVYGWLLQVETYGADTVKIDVDYVKRK